MNLRIICSLGLTSALLIAATPMVTSSMSTDNGGAKLAIDAYSDGGGVLMINQASDTKFDNSSMNKLVFKYGDAAKSSNTTLKNQVNVLSPGATALEKAAATNSLETAKLVINPPVNGTACNDGLSTTSNDVWMNNVCAGINNDGVACDDTNSMTYGDKYTSGVCAGTYALSCKVIKTEAPASTDGTYAIDPDGISGAAPFNAYCDMTTDGGGWTLVRKMQGNIVVSGSTASNNIASIANLSLASASVSDVIWNQLAPTKVWNICNKRQTIYTRNMSIAWRSNVGVDRSCGYNTGNWTGMQTSFSSSIVTSMLYQSCGGAHNTDWGVLSGIYNASDPVDIGCYDASENSTGTSAAPSIYSLDSGTTGWGGHGYVLVR